MFESSKNARVLEADEYFSGKAEQKRMDLSELLTAILKREIEIDEALK